MKPVQAHRILLVDDDRELCDMLVEYLEPEGFDVHCVNDGESGAKRAGEPRFEAMVLDVMLPGMNGFEVLRTVRSTRDIPILMLTARGDDVDRIVGLEMGADDYLPKPFNPRELVARLRALLRRARPAAPDAAAAPETLRIGNLRLKPGARLATQDGDRLNLTSTEYSILERLMQQAGQVVSKADLSRSALGKPLQRHDRSLDVHVSNLRRKLGDGGDAEPRIITVRGVGYQLMNE
jgi:two-component system response regulator CpxR